VIFACFMPHRMHLDRRLALSSCTDPEPLNAARALTVLPLPEWVQSTRSAHLKRIRSAVVRTLLFDIHCAERDENDS
jgi:hypothetical protein